MPMGKKIAAAVFVPVIPFTSSASFLACSACLNSSFKDSQDRSLSESLVVSITFGVEHPKIKPIKMKTNPRRYREPISTSSVGNWF